MTAQDLLKPPGRYKLKVADYLTLDRSGAFDGVRTELIEGEIIVMNPQARPHMFVKDELAYRLRRCLESLGSELFVGTEGSVEFGAESLPQPDIVLTSAPRGEGFIPFTSVALVVEVSVASLDYDLKRKLAFYARHGVPEYWVVDVNRGVIHQMSAPEGEAYFERREVELGVGIEAATIEGLAVDTGGLA
jgi:Uma2 family endonuclease